jgi:hypothetical protein
MKKFLLIALVVGGFAFASAPQSNAGVSVGIGIGFPGPYGYGCPYGGYGYGGYGYGGYGYGYPYHRSYYRPVVYGGPSFYRSNGHRGYYSRRYHRHWR